MTNSLLDFVMSLVRDPDAAARYAQDPSQAIADAHLTGVTSADVNSLIPVVSESLSMGAPVPGADAGHGGNVWASGAATAAFDAFSDHAPDQAIHHVGQAAVDHPMLQGVAGSPDNTIDTHAVGVGAGFQPSAPGGDILIDSGSGLIDSGSGLIDPGVVDQPPVVDDPSVVHHPWVEDNPFGSAAGSEAHHFGSVAGSEDNPFGSAAGPEDHPFGSAAGPEDHHFGSSASPEDHHFGSSASNEADPENHFGS